jgi:hypothetical protein
MIVVGFGWSQIFLMIYSCDFSDVGSGLLKNYVMDLINWM